MPVNEPALARALIQAGTTLQDRFRLTDFLAEGHFSLVFKASDNQQGNEAAVKLLKPSNDLSAMQEISTEHALLGQLLGRDCVVDVFHGGQASLELSLGSTPIPVGTYFLVLELADGVLSELTANRHRVEWQTRIDLFRSVARGLHQMHLDGIAHRDLKSDNVLIFTDRQQPNAKVSDLGRGATCGDDRRFPKAAYRRGRGDLTFAPPELLCEAGSADPRTWIQTDLYLLGSIWYELATGVPLTAAVLGAVADLRSSLGPHDARRPSTEDFLGRAGELESPFEGAWSLARQEMPAAIREQGMLLLRQLTHPDPRRRGPMPRERSVGDLNWILRRVDIIGKQLAYAERERVRLRRKKEALK